MIVRLGKDRYIGEAENLRVEQKWVSQYTPLHAHTYFELEIVLEGNGYQWLNGTRHPIGPGSIYLLSPANFHEVHPQTPILLWNISFDETLLPAEWLASIYANPELCCRQASEQELWKLESTVALVQDEYLHHGCVRPLMEYLMTLVLQGNRQKELLSPMHKAILYIETHFRENPSLAQTAEQACLSAVYFSSLFRKYTGFSYVQYLNLRKVNCAKMLLEGGLSVTETCYTAGFGSPSAFLHTFKQLTGLSPNAYRRQRSKEKNLT